MLFPEHIFFYTYITGIIYYPVGTIYNYKGAIHCRLVEIAGLIPKNLKHEDVLK